MGFSEIALLFFTAATLGVIFINLKQSPLIGYIAAGILLAQLGFISDSHILDSVAKIGVMLLLFLLGLEMKIHEFLFLGKDIVIIGLSQILLTIAFGFLVSSVLGFGIIASLVIGVALSFSSTIVVVKMISEKKDTFSLYGRLSVGILIVQDIFAIVALAVISAFGSNTDIVGYLLVPVKIISLVLLVYILAKKVLPFVFSRFIANSPESLFLAGIAWAFIFSLVVEKYFGLSLEMGGLLAGISLSGLPEQFEIFSKSKPLKEFFLTLFFVNLGILFVGNGGINFPMIVPVVVLVIFVILGKTIATAFTLGMLGYKKRTIFQTSTSLSQISEFSLIVVAISMNNLQLENKYLSIMTLVGVISMIASTYIFKYESALFKKLQKLFAIFERKGIKEKALSLKMEKKNHVVIFGCHRSGKVILKALRNRKKKKKGIVVVDFNPKVFSELTAEGIDVVFGDLADIDVLEAASLEHASLIVSTIVNFEDSIEVIQYLKQHRSEAKTILTAATRREALRLYELGAHVVVVPEIASGDYIKTVINKYFVGKDIDRIGKLHFNTLTSY